MKEGELSLPSAAPCRAVAWRGHAPSLSFPNDKLLIGMKCMGAFRRHFIETAYLM